MTGDMIGRPEEAEATPHYFTYINLVPGDDPIDAVEQQLDEALILLASISDEASRYRYQNGKWSIRQLLSHVTDTERAFAFRVLWFSRGFDAPLPGFDQDVGAAGAGADGVNWASHVQEFHRVRLATISLFRNMPPEGWARGGVASDRFITVRALAYTIPGHVAHHLAILRERYL